jgi:hypothetical protein
MGSSPFVLEERGVDILEFVTHKLSHVDAEIQIDQARIVAGKGILE